MVVEYLLLLMMSIVFLGASFGIGTGPIEMFKKKTPVLAYKIQENLKTGENFNKHSWKDEN